MLSCSLILCIVYLGVFSLCLGVFVCFFVFLGLLHCGAPCIGLCVFGVCLRLEGDVACHLVPALSLRYLWVVVGVTCHGVCVCVCVCVFRDRACVFARVCVLA